MRGGKFAVIICINYILCFFFYSRFFYLFIFSILWYHVRFSDGTLNHGQSGCQTLPSKTSFSKAFIVLCFKIHVVKIFPWPKSFRTQQTGHITYYLSRHLAAVTFGCRTWGSCQGESARQNLINETRAGSGCISEQMPSGRWRLVRNAELISRLRNPGWVTALFEVS